MKNEIILGLNDQVWQLELISNLNEQKNISIKRRCVDAIDLISSIQINKSAIVIMSADFSLLNLETINHILQNKTKVIGVYLEDDIESFDKLINLGIAKTQSINYKDVESSSNELLKKFKSEKEFSDTESNLTIPGLISVWGTHGAPGRTTMAINTAFRLAKQSQPTLLVDLDAVSASIAPSLSLVSEVPGISSVIHDAMYGKLNLLSFERNIFEVSKKLHVLTGISSAKRWPELRTTGVIEVLKFASQQYANIVCDLSVVLPDQFEKNKYDSGVFKRFEHIPKVLELSNKVLFVLQANPLSLIRCNENLEILKGLNGKEPLIILNKVNTLYLGQKYESVINDILLRWTSKDKIIKIEEDIETFAKSWLKAEDILSSNKANLTEAFNKISDKLMNQNYIVQKGNRKLRRAS